jgi:hypothetical protein
MGREWCLSARISDDPASLVGQHPSTAVAVRRGMGASV